MAVLRGGRAESGRTAVLRGGRAESGRMAVTHKRPDGRHTQAAGGPSHERPEGCHTSGRRAVTRAAGGPSHERPEGRNLTCDVMYTVAVNCSYHTRDQRGEMCLLS